MLGPAMRSRSDSSSRWTITNRSGGPSVRRASITAYCALGELTHPATTVTPGPQSPLRRSKPSYCKPDSKHILSVRGSRLMCASVSRMVVSLLVRETGGTPLPADRHISYPCIFGLVSDQMFAGAGCNVLRLTAVGISTRRPAYAVRRTDCELAFAFRESSVPPPLASAISAGETKRARRLRSGLTVLWRRDCEGACRSWRIATRRFDAVSHSSVTLLRHNLPVF
jgi:hypothetical protein